MQTCENHGVSVVVFDGDACPLCKAKWIMMVVGLGILTFVLAFGFLMVTGGK